MKIAVISACDPDDVMVLRSIATVWPDLRVIRPIGQPSRPPLRLREAARAAFYRLRPLQADWRTARRLFGWTPAPALPDHDRVLFTELNGPRGIELLRATAPDVLVLSGAPLVTSAVLEVPRLATVNVHLGITPEYRGSHTLFQALCRGDYDRVGVTLHHVDAGVDTGPVIAQLFPPLRPTDTTATIRAKCAVMTGRALIEFLDTVQAQGKAPLGRPQPGWGNNFRERDRTIREDLQYLARRMTGQRPPRRAGRVVRYYTPATSPTGPATGRPAATQPL